VRGKIVSVALSPSHSFSITWSVATLALLKELEKNWTSMFWDPPKAGGRACLLLPLSGTKSDPNKKYGSPSGPIGKIERVGPETGHGLAPDALSGAATGFQGES